MRRSICANFDKERKRGKCTDYVTMSLCDVTSCFSSHCSYLLLLGWSFHENAWHGLQRLARKRSFHRHVWHSCCCLSFNDHEREILQDTIEVSCQSFLLHFVRAEAKSVDKLQKAKSAQIKKCEEVYWTFTCAAVFVQILTKKEKEKNALTMSLCPYVMWLLVSAAIAHTYYYLDDPFMKMLDMACKGWLGNAASTGSSGIVAAAFHSTTTNAKSYKTQLKSPVNPSCCILWGQK